MQPRLVLLLLLCWVYVAYVRVRSEVIETQGFKVEVEDTRGINDRVHVSSSREGGHLVTDVERVSPGRWPWAVVMGFYRSRPPHLWRGMGCSGTIVTDTIVVSSATCLTSSTYNKLKKREIDLVVRAGDIRLGTENDIDDRNGFVQESIVANYSLHPEFNTTTRLHYNNIAVLRLNSSFNFTTKFVRPVHLPTVEDIELRRENRESQDSLVVTGYFQGKKLKC